MLSKYSRVIFFLLILSHFVLYIECFFAKSGRKHEDILTEITPNKSTITDVVSVLGEPSVINERNGFTIYGYLHEHKDVILITGHTEQEWIFYYFDKNGVLIFYKRKLLDSTKRLLVPVL
jgi:hypothetical protein